MEKENKMGTEPINKLIITMSLPPLCAMTFQYLYILFESTFIAKLNENSLAAISLSYPIIILMLSISVAVGVGINILVAGYLGEKNNEKADEVATSGLFFTFIFGIIINILIIFLMRFYFKSFNINDEIYSLSMEYMFICSFLQVPCMIHFSVEKILQATGDMVHPMLLMSLGVVVNIIFAPLLIFGRGPFPKLGLRGAAISTVLGYIFTMSYALFLISRKNIIIKIRRKYLHLDFKIFKTIIKYGFPSFILNSLDSFSTTFANLFLISYGETCVAFFGIYFRMQLLIESAINGLIQGTLPIIRFNYRAGYEDRAKKAFHYALFYVSIITLFSTIILLIFPTEFLSLFNASENMKIFGINAIRILSLGYIFYGLTNIIATFFQTHDKLLKSNILHLMKQLILLVPLSYILNKIFGMNGLWVSYPLTYFITFLTAIVMYNLYKIKNNNYVK